MNTPADKLNKLVDTKANMKAALTQKGQTPGDVFAEYPAMVRAIPTLADGTIPKAEQATPSISVGSNGLITAEVEQSEGYVVAGKKSATKQLTVQPAKTVTPTKSTQTAAANNVYTTGEIQVAPIPDAYQDVTPVTAGAGDVRQGKIIVDSQGNPVEGAMAPAISASDDGAGNVTLTIKDVAVTVTAADGNVVIA